MPEFDIRPGNSSDVTSLISLNHTGSSDYVWQLDVRPAEKQVAIEFHEVRLPRSIEVEYPRQPGALADDWLNRDIFLVATDNSGPVGYISAMDENIASIARVVDLVVDLESRRRGVATSLLTQVQTWAMERQMERIIVETQSKNYPCIRMLQKFGYEFCGYNDQYYSTRDVALFFGRALK